MYGEKQVFKKKYLIFPTAVDLNKCLEQKSLHTRANLYLNYHIIQVPLYKGTFIVSSIFHSSWVWQVYSAFQLSPSFFY